MSIVSLVIAPHIAVVSDQHEAILPVKKAITVIESNHLEVSKETIPTLSWNDSHSLIK